MTAAGWFTMGTALMWVGVVLALRSIWLAVRLFVKPSGTDPSSTLRAFVIDAFCSGAALGIGSILARSGSGDPAVNTSWHLPLVWWVMPFPAWLCVVSIVGLIASLIQSVMAISRAERMRKLRNAGVWVVLSILGFWLYKRDPENSISMLKGALPLQPATALAIVLFAVAAIAAMAYASQVASSRKVSQNLVAHLALLTGSFVFGIPLVFLLITSFKEDRDMSSIHGIIWVPRVQRTMPYFDPSNPLYETRYEGQNIQATMIEREGDAVKIDIYKPLSLRGLEVDTQFSKLKVVPRQALLYSFSTNGQRASGIDIQDLEDGRIKLRVLEPPSLKGTEQILQPSEVEPIRDVGLRWQNYSEALSYLPINSANGLVFLRNTLIIAILSVIGTILSSSLAAYAFARMRFPGRDAIFAVFLATMMLPGAVTMLPQFLIYRSLGWIDTLLPLWVPAFFGSALNIFMLRQFFRTIPAELEDAAKIDGCNYGQTYWTVMLPQIKPALAVISVTTFLAAWNNFFGPLIYINSPTKMPISYALQLYMSDRGNEPGLLMAFTTLTIIPVLLLFFFAQRYFIEGVTLSGLGGK